MKTFIIAATTADGFIGQSSHHLSTRWTSHADKVFFTETTKKAGVVVMGRSTFDTIGRALPGRRTIVLTTRPIDIEGIETTQETPQTLVERLSKEGCAELAVCGGASVYSQFIDAGVVDELYLTAHPILFGAGVPLLSKPVTKQLQLLDSKNIGDDTVLLHYSVVAE
ncbi:MAG TPA: dihydrofolate reductase family protein [Candidatus Saccharimonadales bacterium]|nr:dihydrofolate reductase family protein [Candidatus Saccharimonadales bacterium]